MVKSLIKIRSEDSEAKSLVFSTWTGKFGDKLGLCFVNILPDKSFFVVYDFYILTQMCWIFWGRLWMKTTFLTLRFTTGLKPNISRQLSFPELCVESFLLSSGATTQSNFNKKIFKKILVFQNFVLKVLNCSLHNRLKTKYFEKFEFSRTLFLKVLYCPAEPPRRATSRGICRSSRIGKMSRFLVMTM